MTVGRPREKARAEKLLQAGWSVIAETGFRSLRISDVARRAGVSTGTVHYYFPTKSDLLLAAFEYNIRQSIERRQVIAEGAEGPLERLYGFVEAYLPDDKASVHTWRIWAEFWAESLHDPSLQTMNEQAYGNWRALVNDLFLQAQERGEIAPGNTEFMADALVAMMDGLALQTIANSHDITPERMRRTCRDFIALFTT